MFSKKNKEYKNQKSNKCKEEETKYAAAIERNIKKTHIDNTAECMQTNKMIGYHQTTNAQCSLEFSTRTHKYLNQFVAQQQTIFSDLYGETRLYWSSHFICISLAFDYEYIIQIAWVNIHIASNFALNYLLGHFSLWISPDSADWFVVNIWWYLKQTVPNNEIELYFQTLNLQMNKKCTQAIDLTASTVNVVPYAPQDIPCIVIGRRNDEAQSLAII